MNRGYLVLENGQAFAGLRFGAAADARGELVFTTGMVGYLETLTDPSYYGQIVVQTFPLIGNYGVIEQDFEHPAPSLSGYVVREWCQAPSNFRSQGDLDAFLRAQGVPGLCGVDTRALTRVLRTAGVMRAVICDAPTAAFPPQPPIGGVASVTCGSFTMHTPAQVKHRVALWDFGAKWGIRRALLQRGCEVVACPAGSSARDILAYRPDGVVLSNGPGDPAVNTGIIAQVAAMAKSGVPMFGICLGHQLMALSQGAGVHKLKFGHRGANQPALHLPTGRVYITSQNHGYAVNLDDLPAGAEPSFINANDGTCEGITYRDFPGFSVQFHPEASAGPLDTGFLFDTFTQGLGVRPCR
ncbi:MAG: carbamoyl phosphate synthase small subunit [Oscillospiraceae bacterium]|jgi:carbamoyl-phosphate synthase small subunit|nr:carbamoyl phosphate synthase small subunit [Oscillospiraceae bacterium]